MKTKTLFFSIAILFCSLVAFSQTYEVMWERVNTPFSTRVNTLLALNKDTFMIGSTTSMFITKNGGESFEEIKDIYLDDKFTKWFKYDSLVRFDNRAFLNEPILKMRYSKDFGETWNIILDVADTAGFTSNLVLNREINILETFESKNPDYDNKRFFNEDRKPFYEVGSSNKYKLYGNSVFVDGETIFMKVTDTADRPSAISKYLQISKDKGTTWVTKDFSNESIIGTEKHHFVSKDIIYYIKQENPTNQTLLQTVLKSTDGGETFTALPIRKEPEETDNSFLWIRFIDENRGFLATGKGLQYTEDGGETWTLNPWQTFGGVVPNNVGGAEVIHFFDENSGYAYNPSNGTVGLWLYKGRKLSSIREETVSKTQETFSLKVYPNPNEGSFTVELPEVACQGCMLRMYNLEGKEVLQRSYSQGEKKMVISQSGLAKGTYLVKLTDTLNRREYTNKVVVK